MPVGVFPFILPLKNNRIGLDQYLDMQGLTFKLKSHKTDPVDAEKLYDNLMTDVGTKVWSTEFVHADFNNPADMDYLNWNRDYQPGYMFRNLGIIKLSACFRITEVLTCNWL